ncbi:MAG: hypothetical protein EON93_04015 [Burkholderiales bacterium]|nr:MAG: hypothetical protein EON93_04015 [Burkholderiales bacterium]
MAVIVVVALAACASEPAPNTTLHTEANSALVAKFYGPSIGGVELLDLIVGKRFVRQGPRIGMGDSFCTDGQYKRVGHRAVSTGRYIVEDDRYCVASGATKTCAWVFPAGEGKFMLVHEPHLSSTEVVTIASNAAC